MTQIVAGRAAKERLDILEMQRSASVPVRLLLAFAGACLTALFAHLRVPLKPVPITGQVFAVLVCGALPGGRYGALSQVFYIALAAVGVPWLAGSAAGLWILTGLPSIGYLYGFIPAALFLGAMTWRSTWARTLSGQIYLMLAAVAIIYLCGVAGLICVLKLTPMQAAASGVLPFIFFDLFKVVAAATVTSRLLGTKFHKHYDI